MTDPQIFESMAALQKLLAAHVAEVMRHHAKLLREQSSWHRAKALTSYESIEEQARLEGMGDAFAIAAEMVDVPARLEAVK